MGSEKYTYRLSLIFAAIIAWEILFWLIGLQLFNFLGIFSSDATVDQLDFVSPENIWGLALLPIFILIYAYLLMSRNKSVRRFSNPSLLGTFLQPVSNTRAFLRYFFIRNLLVLGVLAAMQPAFGDKLVKGRASGVELVVSIDISNSMNVRDMSNGDTRLDAAKRAVIQFINLSASAKVGMVVFAGSVYPQLPLTADKTSAKMHVEQISTDLISNQGTHIGLALERSLELFSTDDSKKVILLVTDGEDHEGGVDAAIQLMKDQKVNLFILAIGSEKGGLVPKEPDYPHKGYIKDELDRSVISVLNREMIQSMSTKAEAPFVISADAYPNVTPLLTQINNLKATKEVDLEFKIKENRYRVPLFGALMMLLGWMLLEIIYRARERREE